MQTIKRALALGGIALALSVGTGKVIAQQAGGGFVAGAAVVRALGAARRRWF